MCSTAFYKQKVRRFISYKFWYFDCFLMYSSPNIKKNIYFDHSERNKGKHQKVR